jgi:hypothetical protein
MFDDIQVVVERIKAKGIKVVYVKETKTDYLQEEDYTQKISESFFGTFISEPPTSSYQVYQTLNNSSNDLLYISNYELSQRQNYNSGSGTLNTDIIGFQNYFSINKINDTSESEDFIFNNIAFYMGINGLYNEYIDFDDVDKFIYMNINYERGRLAKVNHATLDDVIIFDDIN